MKIDQEKKQTAVHITRRMFLQLGFWVSGLASAWGIFQFLNYEPAGEKLLPSITLDKPNTYRRGTAIFIPEVKAWLIRDEDGLYAVSAICTHLGCNVSGEEDRFVCPCHGSEYDLSGRVLQGPATSSLPHFELRLSEDGRIIIDRRNEVLPSSRL
jgi:nitrite reductase/ring-hydroxylating ferredoxin subunit